MVGIGVIGAGYWGPNLIRNFEAIPSAKVWAVCDLDSTKLGLIREKYPGIKITTRLEELLALPDIDAVAIATPAETHRIIAEKALQSGKHVFIEKPLASNAKDAKIIVRTAEAKERVLLVGHLFLYDPGIAEMIRLVQNGFIGEIRYVYGARVSMSGTARLDTNIIWDALVHDVYILPSLFNRKPFRVLAVGGRYLSPNFEDVAFVTFDFGEEKLAHVYVSWYGLEKAKRITVIGSEGILVYDDLSQSRLMHYARRYERSKEVDPMGRLKWRWRDQGGQPIEISSEEPLLRECKHFLECIINGVQPLTDGASGLETVLILEACQESLKNNNIWMEIKK